MKKGFTLIELMVVLAISTILLSMTMLGLNSIQQSSYEQSSLEILLSDIKLQQLKSMTGDTSIDTDHEPYGIYFGTDSYTLFRGVSYNPAEVTNFTVSLQGPLSFASVTIPSSSLIFEKGSGQFIDYVAGQNNFSLVNSVTGQIITVTINEYGVINDINYAQ